MQSTQRQTNVTGGLVSAIVVVLLFGVFVGLPVFVWVFLLAALFGIWVATSSRSKDELSQANARPWKK